MHKRIFAVLGLAAVAPALVAGPALAELSLPRPSPKATITQTVGLTDFTMSFSRPGVKGRKIWGGLVPYGEVWRTGANEATSIELSDDAVIEGKKLAAGKYAIFTIPGQPNWTVIFNSNADQWGSANRKPKNDVMSVVVTPTYGPFVERMGFSFENMTNNSADLVFRWEKLTFPLKIEVDTDAKALASAKEEVPKAAADDWRTPYRAASFLYDADMEMDLAREWAEKSVGIKGEYLNLSLLAKIYAKLGRTDDAIAQAEKAIEAGKSGDNIDTRPTEKLLAEWKAE